jgi:DNA modification methylase
MGTHPLGKNPGTVWNVNTEPFRGAHFATFPPELARRCIAAGCKPGGTVLDPFSGSGTTGMVALNEGRKYVGIDISAEYLDLSLETRFSSAA